MDLSHRQILTVLSGVMAGMLLAALDQSVVGTALPRIVSELGGLDHLSWVVTGYLLTSTAVTPLWGKISDLYGRRPVFQAAITVFLVGSALAGLSQNMIELIVFRAVQGIGGGGLFAVALAIIGDIIPARERGRYQGYFGAVFGVANVAGPLLGGWFTDTIGWRWIFYVNLPVGAAALVITTTALRTAAVRREHRIDYLGATAIVASVSTLLLYLNWAGDRYGWSSASAGWLLAAAVVFGAAFVAVERRAPEPILPLRLFGGAVFRVGNLFSFLAGMAMFGPIIFLPVYLQAVKGMSPTGSGLAMFPTVLGIAGLSVVTGRLVSRTGRYRAYPIAGAATLVVGLVLLTRLEPGTPYWQVGVAAFLCGAGLGATLQTVTTAIQNAVDLRDMGTATSAAMFFRQTGAAIGTAVFGAVLSARLAHHLAAELPAGAVRAGVDANDVRAIRALPEPLRGHVLSAFSAALDDVFRVAVPFVVLAFLVALKLEEIPLRTSHQPVPREAVAPAATATP